ncbi:MAG TPA: ABC transporter ATP-binding protein [Eggerthellaceae bacterium]|nr:ABC transporter ATP-binding protein [Eggerthellaceae bacterium]
MRLFKYLGRHGGAVALVFVLLVCQAFCDLMLPNYTADIVDVGIQQSGIEHASPERLSAQTHDAIGAALSGEQKARFESAYAAAGDGAYELTSAGARDRAALDALVALPLAEARGMAQPGMTDDLANQLGISAAAAEYAALGYDVGGMQLNYLMATALKMMGFVVLSVIISTLLGFVASRTGATIGRELRGQMYRKVMSFSDAEVQRFSAASLITRATNDIQQIQMMSIMLLRMVLYAPILAIGGVVMIMRMDVSMGWIIGVAVAALVAVVLVLMAIALPKFRIMQKLIDRVNLVSREMLTGVQVVRAFGQQQREQRRFDEASTELMRTQLFTNRVMIFMMPTMMIVMNLVSVVIVWVGAGQIDAGVIQPGDLIAFITYSMLIIMGFLMLSMLAVIAPRADVAAKRIDEVLEAEASIADSPGSEHGAATVVPMHSGCAPGAEIAFDHVSFRYDEGSECVLRDVTFTAEAGTTCAIIGSTGSGKSTILKLVERFYDVTEGAVRIDGVDVRAMPLARLRAQLGYVPQKAFLFTGTIESNVGYAEDDMEEDRIRAAIDIAQAGELVEASEEGLDAEITQGGTNVSGGQRQRLAIARALAKDARAYLFDDSFSALDYKTDAALRKALSERLPGKTQIIVAQRIATVMQADKIVVLDEGVVVGQGTHAELLRTCGPYREVALSQLSPEELQDHGHEGQRLPSPTCSEGGDAR